MCPEVLDHPQDLLTAQVRLRERGTVSNIEEILAIKDRCSFAVDLATDE